MKKLEQILDILNTHLGGLITAVAFLVCIGLVIVSFFTPPPFMIDNSVILAIGEIGFFTIISRIPEIIYSIKNRDVKISKGNFSIEVESEETADKQK